jgi:hypothetical protein
MEAAGVEDDQHHVLDATHLICQHDPGAEQDPRLATRLGADLLQHRLHRELSHPLSKDEPWDQHQKDPLQGLHRLPDQGHDTLCQRPDLVPAAAHRSQARVKETQQEN